MDDSAILLLALGIFCGAAVQAATGFGFALIAAPAFFAVLDPQGAVTGLLGLGMVSSIIIIIVERGSLAPLWPDVMRLTCGAIPGQLLGAQILRATSGPLLESLVGAIILASAYARVHGTRRSSPPRSEAWGYAVGFAAGALSTATAIAGPALALWLARDRRLGPSVRASLVVLAVALGASGMAFVVLVGEGPVASGIVPVIALTPVMIVGYLLGRIALQRLDMARYEALCLAFVAGAGALGIVSGLRGAGLV